MALDITGGVKFFENNKALFRDGSDASASTNDEAAKFILDISKYTRWESLSSNDITTETLTINLAQATDLDRLILVGHNLKDYTIQYNGTTEFTNVCGLDGALVGGIVETTYDKDTSYYSFDEVSVSSILITMNTTQTVDAEKFLTQFVATKELGTFQGFPRIQNVQHNRNIKAAKAISGKNVIQKGHEVTTFRMNFSTYPVQADITLLDSLHEREESFLVWLCGGRYGSEYFTIEQRGWRLEDIYNMQLSRPLSANYAKGIYQNGANTRASFVEVI
jgi:hypothetical protein